MAKRYGFSISDWIDQANASEFFDSFKLYVLECYNDEERFIKVGRTFRSVSNRYMDAESMPYSYNIIYEEVDNPYRIYKLENKIKKESKQYRVKTKLGFPGDTECFSLDILNDEKFKQHVNIKTTNI